MNPKEPTVSVVMAVFNAVAFLPQAIESILSQSYKNFEFIIVNDGSTDASKDVIEKYHKLDKRIRPVEMKVNQGVAIASNHGINLAKGKYIARMDADDISVSQRLEKQVVFMENNPEIGILGSRIRYIDTEGNLLGWHSEPQKDLFIRWNLLFKSPFFNSSTLFRKSLLDGYKEAYKPTARYGEDYDLWIRLLSLTKGENLPDTLLYYRLHSSNLTSSTQNILKKEVQLTTQAIKIYFKDSLLPDDAIKKLQGAIRGYPFSAKYKRASLLPLYMKIWQMFSVQHKDNSNITKLKQKVLGDATLLVLFPFFQKESTRSLLFLIKTDWKLPLYFLKSFVSLLQRRWAKRPRKLGTIIKRRKLS